MKHFLLLTLSILCLTCIVQAQITLLSTDFALSATAKDSSTSKLLRKQGAVLPSFGNNQTWDYSSFRDSTTDIYYLGNVTQPASARPTTFAAANMESIGFSFFQNFSIPTHTYYLKDVTGYNYLGDSLIFTRFPLQSLTFNTADSLTFPGSSRKLSSPSVNYKFPMTANTSWTVTNKFTTDFLLKISALNIINTPGQQVRTSMRKDSIVGWGILKLRSPLYGITLNFNVLLGAKTVTTLDSFFLGGQPAPVTLLNAFGLIQGQEDTSQRLDFYGLNFKTPYLVLQLNNARTSIADMFRAILPNLGLVSKNKEITDISVTAKVFPNPNTEGVTFEFDKKTSGDWNVFIYNAAGQIMGLHRVNAPQGTATLKVNFDSATPMGTYFYNIVDENSLIRANGQFVKM